MEGCMVPSRGESQSGWVFADGTAVRKRHVATTPGTRPGVELTLGFLFKSPRNVFAKWISPSPALDPVRGQFLEHL